MHKVFLAAVTILLSFSMFSGISVAQDIKQDIKIAPYIGVYGGYGYAEGNASVVDVDGSGIDYGVFAGLKFERMMADDWGLTASIEANLGGSTIEDSVQIAGVAVRAEKNHEYGVSFRPGFTFKPSASFILNPYAIIGYRFSEYDASAFNVSLTDDFDGVELGLGTNLITYNNFDLRFEYSHTSYDASGLFEPEEDSFRFGLVYHFDRP